MRLRQRFTRTGWRYASVMLVLCLLQVLVPRTAIAESTPPITIQILNSHTGGYYDRFVNAFSHSLQRYADQHKFNIKLGTTLVEDNPAASLADADVYVTVGANAAISLLQSGTTKPAIYTLLPQQTFEQLQQSHSAGYTWHDAVFIDYPASSFLQLIKYATPGKREVGVILGPDSRHHAPALKQAARELGLKLAIETIQGEDEIIAALHALQGRMQVFLALPDKRVHNRRTAKTILLSTYRYNVPVVAYSQAYVKAGALTGMYARPEAMAEQAARKVAAYLANSPEPADCSKQPETLSIEINNSVARLLARGIPDASELQRKMQVHLPHCAP